MLPLTPASACRLKMVASRVAPCGVGALSSYLSLQVIQVIDSSARGISLSMPLLIPFINEAPGTDQKVTPVLSSSLPGPAAHTASGLNLSPPATSPRGGWRVQHPSQSIRVLPPRPYGWLPRHSALLWRGLLFPCPPPPACCLSSRLVGRTIDLS